MRIAHDKLVTSTRNVNQKHQDAPRMNQNKQEHEPKTRKGQKQCMNRAHKPEIKRAPHEQSPKVTITLIFKVSLSYDSPQKHNKIINFKDFLIIIIKKLNLVKTKLIFKRILLIF